jgi:arginyl-tRNA synthetase
MKNRLKQILTDAAKTAFKTKALNADNFAPVEIDEPNIDAHGDFATNFAMVNAAAQKMPPKKIAEAVIKNLQDADGIIEKTEIAGPGFINFFIRASAWHAVLHEIHKKNEQFGTSQTGKNQRVQVEFVSANPTGPLHVGHGRGAVVGDTVASLLSACGYAVCREYYINDSGKQINTLGRSVYLRCMEKNGKPVDFPADCYQGAYVRDIAGEVMDQKAQWLFTVSEEEAVGFCARFAASRILEGIKQDLDALGIGFDNWYSEQALFDSGGVDAAIEKFKASGFIYENEGALWFKTSDFGDEKDRVVVRGNGQTTYFASDIAYHQDKFDRGFEKIIDVWGADHHGYIPRIRAAIIASGKEESRFRVLLINLVNLLREGKPAAMSTRSGEFVTLKEVIDEVGRDAARFIFLTRAYDSPLDFDLELAKQKTNDNPVYYVQYVHARIASILKKAQTEKGIKGIAGSDQAIAAIREPEEIQLLKQLARYSETVSASAEFMEPHRMAFYLMNLAADFHAYYNRHRVLTDDPIRTQGRLYLVSAVQKVIRNGLTLLGVFAPDSM